MMSNIVNCDETAVHCGMPVAVTFPQNAEGMTLPFSSRVPECVFEVSDCVASKVDECAARSSAAMDASFRT
ncbi:hypothetical protein R1CP_37575 (plasmid) [Rhodococcus opacus]|uniref:Uncharacterized protein n=1 Tax=Rhodococcus opacus TaxID=37919 RepID=A0A1B1KHN0_RHOOP|nr:hypothetical protein [Rhodococcus opacus]ANS32116.1 hypothetical protein R1CP_37575 [Rhodococcus opacus]